MEMNLWCLIIIIHCFQLQFSINFACVDYPLELLLNSNFDKFQVVISGDSSCASELEERLRSVPTTVLTSLDMFSHLIQDPLIVFVIPETEAEFTKALIDIEEFSVLNGRNTEWNPMFFIKYYQAFQNRQELLAAINPIAKNFSIGTDLYFLHVLPDQEILIMEAYSIRTVDIVQEAHLNFKKDLIQQLNWTKVVRRSNFRKAPVLAIGMDDPQYTIATKFKASNGTDAELESGFEVSFYQYFRDALNFSEGAVRGIGYVRQGPNGTLTGMAEQINSGIGDISIGAAEFLEYRFSGPDGISYIHPIFHANVKAFFKQPPASSVRNIFTQTFTLNLWAALFLLWGFLIIVLKAATRLKATHELNCSDEDEILSEEAAIWATGVLCQQGWYFSPVSTSMKVTFYFGILFGLLSYIAYSAALVSILSVEVVPIQSFPDLLTENFLITSDSHIPTAKVVVQDLEDRGLVPKLDEGVRNIEIEATLPKLFSSKVAVVTIPDSFFPILQLNQYSEDFVCNTISEKVVSSRPLKSSAFVRRGSPLKEFMNTKLLEMQERGLKSRLLKHYILATSIQCLQSETGFYDSLGLRDVFTAFVLLLFGLTLSFVLALGEKFIVARLLRVAAGLEYDMYL